ncbi:protein SRC2-like [Mangifera indica]|uniref:protein SRC2-like n=1 Tax=Mangifera indica TaxID=29780 RepID=UPI001CF9533B|nr:protein SRC2-like [Mangifera indica]
MEWSTLEVKVISCNDLKAFNFFQKLSVYAVVSIVDGELKKKKQQQKCLQRQKTPIDREGGSNPEWNHLLQINLKALSDDFCHLFVSFDLHCEGVVYGNKSIGKVRVPLPDLIDEFNGAVRFVRYQIRSNDGKPNGVLNFSYKVNGNKIIEKGSPEVILPPEVDHSSLEDVQKSDKISYPSLDYVQVQSPLPKHEYRSTAPPVLSPQEVRMSNGSFYYPYIQARGPCYTFESSYGYSMYGGFTNSSR